MARPTTTADIADHYNSEFLRLYGNSNGKLTEIRKQALDSFTASGLPAGNSEQWRQTDITSVTDKFSVCQPETELENFNDLNFKYLPEIPRLVFVNGYFTVELSDFSQLPEGVEVNSISYLLNTAPEKVAQRLEQSIKNDSTPFASLNGSLFNSGVWVELDAHISDTVSLQLIFLTNTGASKSTFQIRNFIDIGAGSRLNLIEQYVGIGENEYFNSVVNDSTVGENAVLTCAKIQNESAAGSQLALTTVTQAANSQVDSMIVTMGGALVRNDSTIRLNGEKALGKLNGLFLGRDNQIIDNHTLIDHAVPACSSEEMFKGILSGKAQAVFNGNINVRPDAQKTDARQINRNLLLSPDARIHTNPQLEILADDVKCSHGSTTGQFDPDALFYMQSRGISLSQAQSLLINGFASEVLDKIENQSLRQLIGEMVEAWFSHEDNLDERQQNG